MLSRWRVLTGVVLPGMAHACAWPIRLDHCFMRVCLDHAMGQRWDAVVARPAIRHLSDAELARAIAVAEAIRDDPASLPARNTASLRFRGKL